MDEEPKGPLFQDISADDDPGITSVESLCMSCEKNVSNIGGQHFYPTKI